MSSVAALTLNSDFSKRKSQIICDNQKILRINFLLIQPIAYSIAAQIHECGGFEKNKLSVFYGRICDEAVTSILKNNIGCLCKGIQYRKTYIVAGALVFISRIAQSYNQIFHFLCLSRNITLFQLLLRQQHQMMHE